MVALAGDLDLFGACFLAQLTAVFVASLRPALAWQVRTLLLLICRHHGSPFPFPKVLQNLSFEPREFPVSNYGFRKTDQN